MTRVPVVLLVPSDLPPPSLATALDHEKNPVIVVNSLSEARPIIEAAGPISIVAIDLRAGAEAEALLAESLTLRPRAPVLAIAPKRSRKGIDAALAAGVFDAIQTDASPLSARRSVERATSVVLLDLEARTARTEAEFRMQMVMMAAHDFRSMLSVLDAHHQDLAGACADCTEAERRKKLAQTGRAVARLKSMASTLLDYEAAKSGTLRLERRSVALDDLLRDAISFHSAIAEGKGIAVVADGELPHIRAVADPARVLQVIDNLVFNALRFTTKGGEIRIGLSDGDESGPVVSVRDTGEGIDPARLPVIFDEASAGKVERRAGIGLSICRRMVESMGGTIRAERPADEIGTVVSFTLPS